MESGKFYDMIQLAAKEKNHIHPGSVVFTLLPYVWWFCLPNFVINFKVASILQYNKHANAPFDKVAFLTAGTGTTVQPRFAVLPNAQIDYY